MLYSSGDDNRLLSMLYKLFLAILSFIIHDSAGYVNSIQTIFENFAFKSADAIVSRLKLQLSIGV